MNLLTFGEGSERVDVSWDGTELRYTSKGLVDGDGGLHTYNPQDTGRDALANARNREGQYVGLVTINGKPWLRPDGFYTSTTSYQEPSFDVTDPRRYLDAETVPYIVVPPQLIKGVGPVIMGAKAMVKNLRTGLWTDAVVGDEGNSFEIGEYSEAVFSRLGLANSPRNGGTDALILECTIWPGEIAVVDGRIFDLQPQHPLHFS